MAITKRYLFDTSDIARALQELDASYPGSFAPRVAGIVVTTRTFAFFGGPVLDLVTGIITSWVADGTVVCTDNALSVVQRDYSGTVVVAPTLLTTNLPMAIVECAAGVLTHFEDIRDAALDRRGNLPLGGDLDDILVKASATTFDAVWRPPSLVFPAGYPAGPLPLASSCQLMGDALNVGGAADGGSMTTIPNIGSLGGNLTNTGATDRPIYRATDSEDGLPFIEFDGVNDYFERTGMTSYTGTELTAYLIYRALNISTTAGLFTLKKDAFGDFSQSDAFVVIGMDGAGRTLLSRNSVSYSFGEAGGSGLASPDARYTWAMMGVRWKVVEGRAVLTLMRNNKILSYDLGTSLSAFAIVRATLGARNSAGGAADNFAQMGLRMFAYKQSADSILTMRDTIRYNAPLWGVPLLD